VIPIANRHNIRKRNILFYNLPEKAKEHYKTEAKKSELKHRHGYDVASSLGFIDMEMQRAMAIFAGNLKRIIKMMSEKQRNP
jgi:hypothetical protein